MSLSLLSGMEGVMGEGGAKLGCRAGESGVIVVPGGDGVVHF